jgi:hypothetical protein
VPLVDKNYNFFSLCIVNLFKEFCISLIDENSFKMWEEICNGLSVPVDLMLIQALLSECSWTHKQKLSTVIFEFLSPLCFPVVEPSDEIIKEV